MKHFLDSFQNNSCYLFVSLFKISFAILLNCCFSDICGEECKTAYLFIQNSGGFGGKTHASNSGQLLYCCLYIIASHSRPIRIAPQANSFACARVIMREKASYRRYFGTKHTGCHVVIGSYSTLFGATLVATVVLVAENKPHDRKNRRCGEKTRLKKCPTAWDEKIAFVFFQTAAVFPQTAAVYVTHSTVYVQK